MDFKNKIIELEQKRDELIKKRKKQIMQLIEKYQALTLDDELLAKTFFVLTQIDKKHSFFTEIEKLATEKNFSAPNQKKNSRTAQNKK